jgi:hypothetical protein
VEDSRLLGFFVFREWFTKRLENKDIFLAFSAFLFLKEEVWHLSYLEPPENEIRFNAAFFAHSLEGYGLRDDKAKSLESLLSI